MNAQRREYLAEAMREVFGERLRIELHAGGLHLLAMLPPGEDDVQLAARANAAGFGVQALSPWFRSAPPTPGLMMSFTNVADRNDAKRIAVALQAAWQTSKV